MACAEHTRLRPSPTTAPRNSKKKNKKKKLHYLAQWIDLFCKNHGTLQNKPFWRNFVNVTTKFWT